jgi:hypothetical protein
VGGANGWHALRRVAKLRSTCLTAFTCGGSPAGPVEASRARGPCRSRVHGLPEKGATLRVHCPSPAKSPLFGQDVVLLFAQSTDAVDNHVGEARDDARAREKRPDSHHRHSAEPRVRHVALRGGHGDGVDARCRAERVAPGPSEPVALEDVLTHGGASSLQACTLSGSEGQVSS